MIGIILKEFLEIRMNMFKISLFILVMLTTVGEVKSSTVAEKLIHLAADNASIGDIENALSSKNFEYQKDASVEGGFRVDTEKQYKGWAMMQIFSPEIVSEILFMSLGTGSSAERVTGRSAANTAGRVAAKKGAEVGGKELYNFGKTAAQHMTESGRRVPLQLMDDVLKTTKGLPDPGGSRALMHYSPMWKNGKLYNLEILYNQPTNSIWHFKYTQGALGPLKAIP